MIKEESENKRVIIDGLIALILSSVFSYFSILSLFVSLPLLFFAFKHNRKYCSLFFGIEIAFILIKSFFLLKGSEYLPFYMLIDVYIPVSLLVAGGIWIYSNRIKKESRLLFSLLPSFVLFIIGAFVLSLDRALFESIYFGYKDAFAVVFEEMSSLIGYKADWDFLFLSIMTLFSIMILPITVAAICVNIFIYENALHSKESDFNKRIESIEFNQNLIWLLIFTLFVFLISHFISNELVMIISISFMLSLLVVYSVQGFSVLVALIGRGKANFKVLSLFFALFFIAIFLPGLNIIVLFGVPLLGILENFFNLKKRKKDENYS